MRVQNKSQIFSHIISEYANVAKANGKEVPIVTASELVFLKTIPAGGTTNVQFGVLTSDQPILPQEIRLNINDEFIMTDIFVGLYGVMGQATGPATNLSNRYWTYAPYQLDHAFVTLLPFWDTGILSLLVNSTQIIKNWSTNKHNWIPRTQEGAASAATTIVNASLGNGDLSECGFAECAPTITLSGAKTNVLTLNFQGGNVIPTSNFAFVTDAANDVYFSINTAAFIAHGFLAQNAAQFQGSQEGHQHMQHKMALKNK
jgi:hypothetical protein